MSSTMGSCALLVCLPAFGQSTERVPILEGQTLGAAQRADETRTYVFAASAGRTYLSELEQRGFDLILTVEMSDGSAKVYNSPLRRDERELVVLDATTDTEYRITVSSNEFTGVTGAHSLRISPLDTENGPRLQALRLMTEAALHAFSGGQAGSELAIAAYQAADRVWVGLDELLHAYTTFAVAMLAYWEIKDRELSAEFAATAAQMYSALGEPILRASALHLEAASLIEIAEESEDPAAVFAAALDLFAQARDLQVAHDSVFDAPHSINNMGLTHYYMGDWASARQYWNEAAPMFRDIDEWSGELFPLANIGVIDAEEGYLTTAAAAFRRALEIFPDGQSLRHRLDTLANLGGVERLLGNFDAALGRFTEALALADMIEDVYGEGWALFGLGQTYLSMGEIDLAKHFLERSLPKERAAGDSRGEAAVLRYLGLIDQLNGNYGSALTRHREALGLATSPPDRALVLMLVSQDLVRLGQHEEAVAAAGQALAIAGDSGSALLLADALEQSGRTQLSMSQTSTASELAERAGAMVTVDARAQRLT